MCGIFGLIAKTDSEFDRGFLQHTVENLGRLSESRGKESAGFAIYDLSQEEINVLKGTFSISRLLETRDCREFFRKSFGLIPGANQGNGGPLAVIGHSRLVTNGSQLIDYNNQPVIKDGIVGIHNGIIVNVDKLWQEYPTLRREYEVDTEVILALLRMHLKETGNLREAIAQSFHAIQGTASIATLLDDNRQIVLATNNGSLYLAFNQKKDLVLFASEKYILSRLLTNKAIANRVGECEIIHVNPNLCYLIDTATMAATSFSILRETTGWPSPDGLAPKARINVTSIKPSKFDALEIASLGCNISPSREAYLRGLLQYNIAEIRELKRCSKCLLPETFPFIYFDEQGVCSFCRNYVQKNNPNPMEKLAKLVAPYRRKNGEPDCIVPFSGGRDSTYTLHVVKKELGLNPVAFTYDWGMVTDLARRNIARVCGKLGVENILVSADIRWKRENIRKNVSAWLRRPELGMVPLFMAGDKYFFYYTQQVKKQTGILLNIWGINPLENTDFKVGFCGIPPKFNKERIYSLSLFDQMKLFSFVGRNFLLNSKYVNTSIFDTLGSILVRYLFPKRHYYHLYDYVRWDENVVESTILNEYDWETAVDTTTTWRIGDGTASFYNYIYYTVSGFSEYDTFRSNQIREGMLSRDEALNLVNKENKPRYESIKLYLDTISLDFEEAIKTINNIPKLYDN
jgi:glucosamine--fructose-6-phosphate aminotransferase (isomerizing)